MLRLIRGRLRRARPLPLTRLQFHDSPDTPPQEIPSTDDIGDLWKAALDEYHQALQIDLRNNDAPFIRDLGRCTTSGEVLEIIQNTSGLLSDKRQGKKPSRAIRRALKPIVHHLHIILDAAAETGSSLGVPGGKGIFAAVAILLKAADRVSAAFNDMEKLLQRLRAYVTRLKVRVRVPLKSESKDIAVMALVKILKTLASLTRIVQRGRIQHFLYALFSDTDEVGSAFEGLEEAAVEEERMAIAELVVGVEHMSSMIHVVDASIANLSQSLDVIRPTLELTNTTTRAILSEARDNRMHNEAMAEMLHTLLDRTIASTSSITIPSLESTPASADAFEQHMDLRPTQTTYRLQSVNLGGQLRQIISRFGAEDQDLIWRALVALFSWVVEAEGGKLESASSLAVVTLPNLAQAAETVVSMIVTFLVLFMTWKLFTVSRPIGLSPDSLIIVDVLGEVFVLGPETFSTWENTHNFLLQAFQGRVGMTYVQRRDYGLGDSDHAVIEPRSWPQLVRSGSRLNMSIVIRERTPQCPYCRTERDGREVVTDDGRIICAHEACGRPYGTYTSLNKDAPTETPTDVETPASGSFELFIPGSFIEDVVSLPKDAPPDVQPSHTTDDSSSSVTPFLNPRLDTTEIFDASGESLGQFQRIVVETTLQKPSTVGVDDVRDQSTDLAARWWAKYENDREVSDVESPHLGPQEAEHTTGDLSFVHSSTNDLYVPLHSRMTHESAENLKRLKVSLEDTARKVLPVALERYQINGDWKDYALFITYGPPDNRSQRCLSFDEKPLLIFRKLEDKSGNPIFMVKHIKDVGSPLAVAQKKRAARTALKASADNSMAHHATTTSLSPGLEGAQGHDVTVSRPPEPRLDAMQTPTETSLATGESVVVPGNPELASPTGGEPSGSAQDLGYCVAIFPYMAESEDEMDVIVGDAFVIIVRKRKWWLVQRDARGMGVFDNDPSQMRWVPAGTQLETRIPIGKSSIFNPEPSLSVDSRTSSRINPTARGVHAYTPILPSNVIAKSFPSHALADYKGKDDDGLFELDLVMDEALRVYKRYNHWAYVVKEKGGERGWVPSWYLRKVSRETSAQTPSEPANGESSKAEGKGGANTTFDSETL
ncbi:hypothetical protein PENSPDRAFT_600332 [Peniophora sp. CONT]|nr:hypothetical protein PENSPDRAFT_600332 [Peniophora sp. CONT]